MSQQLAIVVGSDNKSFSVKSIDIPKPESHEILVKVQSAAQNPADWKTIAGGFSSEGYIPGCELAGVVEEVGSEVTNVNKGDRIATFIFGNCFKPAHGSCAQYARVDGKNFYHIPEEVSFDEAATLPVAFQTATMGLYYDTGLNLPEPTATTKPNGTPILVWGGSTSVGQAVIQLAKLSGFTVITTASENNHEFLKSLGADHVLPYSDPNTPAEIKTLTNNKLYLGYDTISEKGSTQGIIDAFGSDIPAGKKKEVLTILKVRRERLGENAKDVEIHYILAYTLLGKEITAYGWHLPASPKDYEFSLHSFGLLNKLIKEKKLQSQRVKVFGGLENLSEGFEYMKAGKNSGQKIIYHPQETKA